MRWLPFVAAMAAAVAGAPASRAAAETGAVETAVQALMEDAAEYSTAYGVPPAEALARIEAQQASVAETDRLQEQYRDRLAGVVIEHVPAYRIVVVLTGTEPVADSTIVAGGMTIPVMFRTGALATRAQILAAIGQHQAEIRAALRHPPGMGVDPRTGTLLVMVRGEDVPANELDAVTARLTAIAGVPVRIVSWADADRNLDVAGGGRLVGVDAAAGRRFTCTAGFVVTDGLRTGVTTAAHCPDELSYVDQGGSVPLTMIGAWGARYQDVQIHIGEAAMLPLFHPDTARSETRPVTSWRNHDSTRAGDFVCHRGERTGYSCAEIALVDYAPPGDLCAGPCEPRWVAVRGPHCRSGDSGGPVFSGTIAFGIVKGGTYDADGTCRLYYYMSTDYLPPGWTVLHE